LVLTKEKESLDIEAKFLKPLTLIDRWTSNINGLANDRTAIDDVWLKQSLDEFDALLHSEYEDLLKKWSEGGNSSRALYCALVYKVTQNILEFCKLVQTKIRSKWAGTQQVDVPYRMLIEKLIFVRCATWLDDLYSETYNYENTRCQVYAKSGKWAEEYNFTGELEKLDPNSENLGIAVEFFKKMPIVCSPHKKLKILNKAMRHIEFALASMELDICADNKLTIFMQVAGKAEVPNLYSSSILLDTYFSYSLHSDDSGIGMLHIAHMRSMATEFLQKSLK